MEKLNQTWDLDVFYPGGSESPQLWQELDSLEEEIREFEQYLAEASKEDPKKILPEIIEKTQEIQKRLRKPGTVIHCLLAQNVKDENAKVLRGKMSQLNATFGAITAKLDDLMLELSDNDWNELMATEPLKSISFALSEARENLKEKLAPNIEAIITQLSVDGYHAWSSLYSTIAGRMSIDAEIDGTKRTLSIGQANNLLDHQNREVRKEVFYKLEEAWEKNSDLVASALNHIGGYRLNLYNNRGWESVLKEPIKRNRIEPETLQAMWDAIEEGKPKVVKYLEKKAELLGLEKLSWFDLEASVGKTSKNISYEEAADFVVKNYAVFSSEMAEMAEKAFKERWIEAEDRPNKDQGAFCAGFPEVNQSRIFMTFGGTTAGIGTLAHELGHAYHGYVTSDLHPMQRRYPSNLAETASIFGELLVNDAAIKQATDKLEKLALLENKVRSTMWFFMNLHCRFIFEVDFYETRRKGLVRASELNDLMLNAQRKAFCDSLEVYHQYFWASKGHFYSTGTPFYNFPYTFGYLFSTGIYARALEEGPSFAGTYRQLLRETGMMSVEDLARKYLDVDLRTLDFWRSAVRLATSDIDEFIRLADDVK